MRNAIMTSDAVLGLAVKLSIAFDKLGDFPYRKLALGPWVNSKFSTFLELFTIRFLPRKSHQAFWFLTCILLLDLWLGCNLFPEFQSLSFELNVLVLGHMRLCTHNAFIKMKIYLLSCWAFFSQTSAGIYLCWRACHFPNIAYL